MSERHRSTSFTKLPELGDMSQSDSDLDFKLDSLHNAEMKPLHRHSPSLKPYPWRKSIDFFRLHGAKLAIAFILAIITLYLICHFLGESIVGFYVTQLPDDILSTQFITNAETFRILKTKNLVVAGIATNNVETLAATFAFLNMLSIYFKSTSYVLYDHMSTDGTAQALADWKANHENRNNIVILNSAMTAPTDPIPTLTHTARVAHATAIRNSYLKLLSLPRYADTDYVLGLDLGIYNIDPRAILTSFSTATKANWAAVGANFLVGTDLSDEGVVKPDSAVDGDHNTHSRALQHRVGSGWVKTYDMMDGLTIFKYSCLKQCADALEHTDVQPNLSGKNQIYSCMSKIRGCEDFYINTQMVVDYVPFKTS